MLSHFGSPITKAVIFHIYSILMRHRILNEFLMSIEWQERYDLFDSWSSDVFAFFNNRFNP